ncbi:MAG: AI-2E family transporter [Bacteriovoracaceae bacterium]|nr:AI-2E family transporter [Bacteriovoracaceae bacterium]
MKSLTLPQAFFAVVFTLLIILNWILFKSIIHPLIFGAIMAGSFAPLNVRLKSKLGGREQLSSIFTCIIILLVVILPCVYIMLQLSKESIEIYRSIKDGLSRDSVNNFLFGNGYFANILSSATEFFGIKTSMHEIESKVLSTVQGMSGSLFQIVNGLFSNIISFSFNFILMLLTTYSLLLEGHRLKDYLLKLSPLPDDQEIMILEKFNQMNYVTLVCNGIGGLIQGFLAGIAFWIVGIENIFLWFVSMVILAFIPLLGISVITIPACVYLILIGSTTKGVLLFVWCTTIGLVVENWFKPKFIGKRIQVNSLLVLFYIIGGMAVFGMAGIFYGPLICVIFMTIVEIYHDNYSVT